MDTFLSRRQVQLFRYRGTTTVAGPPLRLAHWGRATAAPQHLECRHLPLGIHGAILPFILAPTGFFLGRCLGFLETTGHGLTYFGVVDVHYAQLALLFPVVLIVYYLVWKYLIGFFNQVAGIAEL
jgi:hypothetical protein